MRVEDLTKEHVDKVLQQWVSRTLEKDNNRPEMDSFDIEKIEWHRARSQRTGEYFERSVDRNNPHFWTLVNALKLNESRALIINGRYVWLFQDNQTLGRKLPRE